MNLRSFKNYKRKLGRKMLKFKHLWPLSRLWCRLSKEGGNREFKGSIWTCLRNRIYASNMSLQVTLRRTSTPQCAATARSSRQESKQRTTPIGRKPPRSNLWSTKQASAAGSASLPTKARPTKPASLQKQGNAPAPTSSLKQKFDISNIEAT